jgi:hypothetical protein
MVSEILKPKADFTDMGSDASCSVRSCDAANSAVGASLSANLLPVTGKGAFRFGSDVLVDVAGVGDLGEEQVRASVIEGRLHMLHVTSQQRQQQFKLLFTVK